MAATKERARSLREYKRKRDFAKTPEPDGGSKPKGPERLLVVQKHRASALHYDFRLEAGGVLVSWAVPKGPSLDPKVKRLAMAVEDHPLGYARFEGVIPEGEYGGGTVMVWDIGTYRLEGDETFDEVLRKGRIVFTLDGKKLKGGWALVRTNGRQWLLMKRTDRHASTTLDITKAKPRSVLTRRLLAGIARDEGGDVAKAATGDPGGSAAR
ncbi:MAG TPA: DNA polymerase ligase N-terminal domain-containing protein [Verrucomicrobiae bacterium]|nr:DNA polymerase ligase N-terminal domain-containing protein [Verrucomicrobiae bacterium]